MNEVLIYANESNCMKFHSVTNNPVRIEDKDKRYQEREIKHRQCECIKQAQIILNIRQINQYWEEGSRSQIELNEKWSLIWFMNSARKKCGWNEWLKLMLKSDECGWIRLMNEVRMEWAGKVQNNNE